MGVGTRDTRKDGAVGAVQAAWAAESLLREKKMYELLSFKKGIDTVLRTKYGHLTGRQLLVLHAVASRGGLATLTEVAHANRCSTQAARVFVNVLQEEGYLVVFEPRDGDKRRIDIALTDAGMQLAEVCPEEAIGDYGASAGYPEKLVADVSAFFEQWSSAASANG